MPKLRGNKRKTEDDNDNQGIARPKAKVKHGKQAKTSAPEDMHELDLVKVQKDGSNSNTSEVVEQEKEITQESPPQVNDSMTCAVIESSGLDTHSTPENHHSSFNATHSEKIHSESNQHNDKQRMEIDDYKENGSPKNGSPVEFTHETGPLLSETDIKEKILTLNSDIHSEEKIMATENVDDVQIKEATENVDDVQIKEATENVDDVQIKEATENVDDVQIMEATCSLPLLINDQIPQENHINEKEIVLMEKDKDLCNMDEAKPSSDVAEGPGLLKESVKMIDEPMTVQLQPPDAYTLDQKEFLEKENIGVEREKSKLTEYPSMLNKQEDLIGQTSGKSVKCPDQCDRNFQDLNGNLDSNNLIPQQINETKDKQEDILLENQTTLRKVEVNSNSENVCSGEKNQQSCVNLDGNSGEKTAEVLNTNVQETGTSSMETGELIKNLAEIKDDDSTNTQPFELNLMESEIEKLTQEEAIEKCSDKQQLGDESQVHLDEPPVSEAEVPKFPNVPPVSEAEFPKFPKLSFIEPSVQSPELGQNENVQSKSSTDENNVLSMKSVELSESQLCQLVSDDNFDMSMLDDEQLQEAEEDMAFRESLNNGKARATEKIDKMITEGEQKVEQITGELSLINKQLLKMKRRIEMAHQIAAQVPAPIDNRSRINSLGKFGFFK